MLVITRGYIQSEIPKCNSSTPGFCGRTLALVNFWSHIADWGWLGMYWGYDGILFHIQSTLFDMISYNMISFLVSYLFDMVNGLCNGMYVYNCVCIYIYRTYIYHIYIYTHTFMPVPHGPLLGHGHGPGRGQGKKSTAGDLHQLLQALALSVPCGN